MNCTNHPEVKAKARGLCPLCYMQARRDGTLTVLDPLRHPQRPRTKRPPRSDPDAFTGTFRKIRIPLTPEDVFSRWSVHEAELTLNGNRSGQGGAR